MEAVERAAELGGAAWGAFREPDGYLAPCCRPGSGVTMAPMRSSAPKLLDTAKRSAADVLQDHLQLREAAELEEDLRRNYATDVVLLSARGVLRGHEGVRASAAFLYEAGAGHEFRYHLTVVEDRMAMLEWSATGHDMRIVDGVDSYLIEGGTIKAQTIHYRVESRELSVSWDAATHSLETARSR
jgi:glycine/D-amino acid oxidase-like deaminating enzyme